MEDLDQRLVQSDETALDQTQDRDRRDRLGQRRNAEARRRRDRHAVAPMRDAAGVLEDGGAVAPGERRTAELVAYDPAVEPRAKGIDIHGLIASGVGLERETGFEPATSCLGSKHSAS